MTVEVHPVTGIPEIRSGDDLGAIIAAALPLPLRDGDVVVVTQKAVSKAEDRVVDAAEGKTRWVERETRRVVARRGDVVIAETRHGFVCANAGVDASNVAEGFLSLLPEDPDASAERIRRDLTDRTGRDVAVVVTDTFGRPWRRGLVEVAIGCAGLPALVDLRGSTDAQGRELETTMLAHADAVAAAAGLVMAKAAGVPAAVVRGATNEAPAGTARDLIRPAEEDMFRHSPLQAIAARRTVRSFGDGSVPREALVEAVSAALTAPVPHGSRRPTRPWTWTILESAAAKRSLIDAMASAWARDLREDGADESLIARRLARSDAVLGAAPVLAVPFLSMANADAYPDDRRRQAERDMFVLASGASVQNFMLALDAQGVASAWVSASMFCRDETAGAVGLDRSWLAMGTVAVGPPPGEPPPPRPPVDPSSHLDIR